MDRLLPRARNPLILTMLLATASAAPPDAEMARWRAEAGRVTITRDDWGIPHIHGRSDSDAVFGMSYAQAEDDFARVEANYLTALGRTAEADGEEAIWADLRQRLFVDPDELRARYAASPGWLRALMQAWADGLNYYLATHPGTKPRVLTRFEPWMALSFTEGSIGGDIERISLADLKTFYGQPTPPSPEELGMVPREPSGSNGIAIAPRLTRDGHALLLINPHTSFYFRSEAQVTSDAGLNAYGASTWGQFFVYQGFNAHAGWMHTSSTVDNVDQFAERVIRRSNGWAYRHGGALRPVTAAKVTLRYRSADGSLGERRFDTWRTHHGPIVAAKDGRWIAIALMWRPVPALEQSWLRTKTANLADFLRVSERKANSSNDTLFADDRGEIAFLMPQRSRDRLAWPAQPRQPAQRRQSARRLGAQHQRLALERRRTRQSEGEGLSPLYGPDRRQRARRARRPAAYGQARLDAGRFARCRLRSLSACVRAARARPGRRMASAAAGRSAPSGARRADRDALELGLSLGRTFDRDQPRGLLGRRTMAGGRQLRPGRARQRAGLYRDPRRRADQTRRAGCGGCTPYA
jgi:acyl-homoserine lactone acylase PvdQ